MKDAKNKLKMLFEASDENGNGVMEMDEFMQMIESLKTDVSEREVFCCSKFTCMHLKIHGRYSKCFKKPVVSMIRLDSTPLLTL
jgi:hypothetical protein